MLILLIFCVFSVTSFGGTEDKYPHPEVDFKAFLSVVDAENKRVGKVFDPVKGKMREWISRDKLCKLRGDCITS